MKRAKDPFVAPALTPDTGQPPPVLSGLDPSPADNQAAADPSSSSDDSTDGPEDSDATVPAAVDTSAAQPLPPEAFDWHKRPAPFPQPCPICGFTKRQGGQHRRTADGSGWERRWKSSKGWFVLKVCLEIELKKTKRKKVWRGFGAVCEREAAVVDDSTPANQRLTWYFGMTFSPKMLGNRSQGTVDLYGRSVANFVKFTKAGITIAEIDAQLIDAFADWCCETKGSGLNSVEMSLDYRRAIRAIVRHANPRKCQEKTGNNHGKNVFGPDRGLKADRKIDVPGSLWRFFRDQYQPDRMVGKCRGAVQQYETTIRRLAEQMGQPPLISKLSDRMISDYQKWMLDRGYSVGTINPATTRLLTIWNAAADYGLIETRPRVRKLVEPVRLPEAWSMDEFSRLLAACGELLGQMKGIPLSDWWRAVLLLDYDTGLRKRAIGLIQRDQLNLDTRWLIVPPGSMKTKVEQRFRLSEDTIEAIRKIWLPERQLLFPGIRNQKKVRLCFDRLLQLAGLSPGRKQKFHKIRRTTATHLAASPAGIPAAVKQLGHSSETVTKRYIDPRFISEHDNTGDLPRPNT